MPQRAPGFGPKREGTLLRRGGKGWLVYIQISGMYCKVV